MQQLDDQLSSTLHLQSVPLLTNDGTGQPKDLSDCDSVVVQVEEQSVSQQPEATQSSRPQSARSDKPDVQQDSHEQQPTDNEDVTTIPIQEEEEEDSALIMSPEAQQLAVEILHHSLTTLDQPNTEEVTELAVSPSAEETHHDNEVLNKEVSCQTTTPSSPDHMVNDTPSSPDHTASEAQTASQLENQSDINEDSTVHKTTSTIFVDLSKLQESPSSD